LSVFSHYRMWVRRGGGGCARLRGPGQKRMSRIAVQRESVCRHPLAHRVDQWVSFQTRRVQYCIFRGLSNLPMQHPSQHISPGGIQCPGACRSGHADAPSADAHAKANQTQPCDYGTKHQTTSPALGSGSQADLSGRHSTCLVQVNGTNIGSQRHKNVA
jgi:hypothetical protein